MTAGHRHEIDLLGSYVLGALEVDETAAVEAHLAGCAPCRDALMPLQTACSLLEVVPPEAFLEGAADGSELLLPRTLRALRAERHTGTGWRRARFAVAAALAGLAFTGGIVITHLSLPGAQPDRTAALPDLRSLAGAPLGSVVDPVSGARLTATMERGPGGVTVHARIGGVAAGEHCRLIVVTRAGQRELAGSWAVSPVAERAGLTIAGSAAVPATQVDHIEIDGTDGAALVSLPA
jgi:hypothetical protein